MTNFKTIHTRKPTVWFKCKTIKKKYDRQQITITKYKASDLGQTHTEWNEV